uniref:ATP synthase F0 subunit 8 n=1 Tax=Haemaphysalis sulcata TaxID=490559 RepID=UPI001FAE7E79|nr:ATP synthase F0 subunit 8 [Haemaphysalis sulcata]UNO53926.1 ATP synthase F0 subunit 8 [Haemaphysalis sulcata]
MPQIFPTNWILISTLILILLAMIMIMTFFLKFLKFKKSHPFKSINNKLTFKW